MIVFDTNVLSEYLNGTPQARSFFEAHEDESWGVSTIVLYEALMGATYGYIDADPGLVESSISASMDVLSVTTETSRAAQSLQDALLERGTPVDQLDALIAASAIEHGARFATAERTFWKEAVQAELDVAPYQPS